MHDDYNAPFTDHSQMNFDRLVNDVCGHLYRLGQELKSGNEEQDTQQCSEQFHKTLQLLLNTHRFIKLQQKFALSPLEMHLIAITFASKLEPKCITPFIGSHWFEQGRTLTLECCLMLCRHSQQSKLQCVTSLLSGFNSFRWRILTLAEPGLSLELPLELANEVFFFLAGFVPDNNIHSVMPNSVVSHYLAIFDPAVAVCFDKQLALPAAKLNKLSGLNIEERNTFLATFASVKQSLWHVVNISIDESLPVVDFISGIRQAILLSTNQTCMVYWPDLLAYLRKYPVSYSLLSLLIAHPDLCLFYDQESDESTENWLFDQLLAEQPDIESLVIALTLPDNLTIASVWQELSNKLIAKYPEYLAPLNKQQAEHLANFYPLYPKIISKVMNELSKQLKSGEVVLPIFELLQEICLQQTQKATGQLAQLSQAKYRLNDMLLADVTQQQLQELIDRLRYKNSLSKALNNFKPGIQALFWGKPGTGKSMAAEAIAGQLKLPLYKVNLANVASKWIGETEKHLAKLFDDAEKQQAVLLFDEADAIFAKRSEVESSHDKNANMGVSFLLQRMESYTGLLLLTSNFKSNLDDAFLRRFHATIEFAMPDQTIRGQLWQRALSGTIAIEPNIELDTLAEHFEFNPSQINNIAERAVLFALKDKLRFINKQLLSRAILRELEKHNAGFLAGQLVDTWLNLS